MSPASPWRSGLRRLGEAHDAVTRLGFVVAGACLVLIVSTYCYEVVARYFFNAPTTWASSLVSYLLCYVVFLAIPELSRTRTHIFISIVLDELPDRAAHLLHRGAYLVAAVACLFAAVFCFQATEHQFVRGIETVNEWRVPKWVLSATLPYSFFSTGIYYLRHLVTGYDPAAHGQAAV